MSIDCVSIEKSFQKRQILDHISFTISQPSIGCLVGHNGSGKTTLLKIMAGLDGASNGDVFYFGEKLKRKHLREVGIVYASAQPVILNRSVYENLAYPLKIRHLGEADIQKLVSEMLLQLGLETFTDRNALSLSVGEKQKLSLGRALIAKPKILLLDEPTANIDTQTMFDIEAMLLNYIRDTQGFILMATHDLQQAERVGSKIFKISSGKLIPYAKTADQNIKA